MEKLLKYLDMVIDNRQEKKIQHKMSDIIALVFFATLANANEWVSIEIFGKEHEKFLRRYLELPNGMPSHDTINGYLQWSRPSFCKVSKRYGTKC